MIHFAAKANCKEIYQYCIEKLKMDPEVLNAAGESAKSLMPEPNANGEAAEDVSKINANQLLGELEGEKKKKKKNKKKKGDGAPVEPQATATNPQDTNKSDGAEEEKVSNDSQEAKKTKSKMTPGSDPQNETKTTPGEGELEPQTLEGLLVESLKCPICMVVMQKASMTRCGHTFCHKCILKVLKSSFNCPMRCQMKI